MIAIVFATCLAVLLPALARPTLPFGVRVTHDRVTDPAVTGQRRTYPRLVIAVGVVALAGAVLVGAAPVWAAVAVAGDFGVYLYANHRIRAAKRKGGWGRGLREGVTVDTSFRTDPVRLPWRHLTPAAALFAATAVAGLVRYPGLPRQRGLFSGCGVRPGAATGPNRGLLVVLGGLRKESPKTFCQRRRLMSGSGSV